MINVNIADFRNSLSDYLHLVEFKEETINIIDKKKGKTVAKLVPHIKRKMHGSIFDSVGIWKGTELDDDELWKKVFVRKSRKNPIQL